MLKYLFLVSLDPHGMITLLMYMMWQKVGNTIPEERISTINLFRYFRNSIELS
jgi:hypothetical protein